MSPFKVALWIAKFVASLALFAGLAYGAFLLGALGLVKIGDAYQGYKLTRYSHRVEVCVQQNGGDTPSELIFPDDLLLPPPSLGDFVPPSGLHYYGYHPTDKKHKTAWWRSVREYCDTVEAK